MGQRCDHRNAPHHVAEDRADCFVRIGVWVRRQEDGFTGVHSRHHCRQFVQYITRSPLCMNGVRLFEQTHLKPSGAEYRASAMGRSLVRGLVGLSSCRAMVGRLMRALSITPVCPLGLPGCVGVELESEGLRFIAQSFEFFEQFLHGREGGGGGGALISSGISISRGSILRRRIRISSMRFCAGVSGRMSTSASLILLVVESNHSLKSSARLLMLTPAHRRIPYPPRTAPIPIAPMPIAGMASSQMFRSCCARISSIFFRSNWPNVNLCSTVWSHLVRPNFNASSWRLFLRGFYHRQRAFSSN